MDVYQKISYYYYVSKTKKSQLTRVPRYSYSVIGEPRLIEIRNS